MEVIFHQDTDLEVFDQLQGNRIRLFTADGSSTDLVICGVEEEDLEGDQGYTYLYGWPMTEDGDCPGYDRYLSTREPYPLVEYGRVDDIERIEFLP